MVEEKRIIRLVARKDGAHVAVNGVPHEATAGVGLELQLSWEQGAFDVTEVKSVRRGAHPAEEPGLVTPGGGA